MIAEFECQVNAGLCVGVIGEEQGMAICIVIGSQLGFDIRKRDIAPDADVEALAT
jgi:hypothetical protein